MTSVVDTRVGELVGRYLDLAESEAKIAAANMANVDTPGYRAVGMDFAGEMRAAMQQVDTGGPQSAVRARLEDGLIARPDGNDVSIDRESLNLADAQLKFKTGIALLRQEYQQVMDAIHADK
jgi:flagellar basal-body rod protein FlgB